ncbi:hypothetical protein B4P00_07130 [Shewanella xiamenensis]|nr:hypothetical protein [Shewanella xiamenensis]
MDTLWLTGLSTDMEVTVGGMDAAVEPSGMSSRRVTEMAELNRSPPSYLTLSKRAFDCGSAF